MLFCLSRLSLRVCESVQHITGVIVNHANGLKIWPNKVLTTPSLEKEVFNIDKTERSPLNERVTKYF